MTTPLIGCPGIAGFKYSSVIDPQSRTRCRKCRTLQRLLKNAGTGQIAQERFLDADPFDWARAASFADPVEGHYFHTNHNEEQEELCHQ